MMFLSRATRALPTTRLLRRSIFPAMTSVNTVPWTDPEVRTMATGRQRISDVVKHDHRELENYYTRIINSNDTDEQVRYQNQFIWELARHSIGEELVVYPELEKISGGQSLADKDRRDHQKVKEQLYEFQKLKPTDARFLPVLKTLMNDLSEHIASEERDDLPALETNINDTESQALATSFSRTKHFVPTRSHPSAPNKPPFETVVGLMAAPLDRLADVFRRFPKD